uniref:Uncharacterized protein n=1 Tax=Globodera rostochiensis TaxID=31243 RepID=A0A914GV35_GLORO
MAPSATLTTTPEAIGKDEMAMNIKLSSAVQEMHEQNLLTSVAETKRRVAKCNILFTNCLVVSRHSQNEYRTTNSGCSNCEPRILNSRLEFGQYLDPETTSIVQHS